MDKVKIFLEDGNQKIVNSIFYLYNSKYYFLYTLNELDENGYVRLYLSKVGKETTNTENGLVETGNMIGIEVPTEEEWKEVQTSISKIVNSKKTKIEDNEIKYLPMDMLVNLKIVGKKTFRLLSGILESDFGVNIKEDLNVQQESNDLNDSNMNKPIEELLEEKFESIIPINDHIGTVENETEKIDSPIKIETQEITEPQSENIIEAPVESSETNTENGEIPQVETVSSEQINKNEENEYENSDIIIDYRTRFFEEQEKNKRLKEEIQLLEEKLSNVEKIIKGE